MKPRFIVTILVLFLFNLDSFGQFHSQSGSTLLQIGYANLKPEAVDVDLDGFTANLSYEYLNFKKFMATGISISYIEGTGTDAGTNYKYYTWPITFQAKGFLGGEKFRGYVKGQAGFQSTTAKIDGSIVNLSKWETGWTAGGGLGLNLSLSEKIFLNLEYNATWLDTNIYEGQIIHLVQLGIGIQ